VNLSKFPRKNLGFLPTPLVELRSLSKFLSGPRLFIKRDDLTGLAFGGNKTRKLEFLIGEAIASGSDTIVTGGAEQSNHCRQTAAAAAACGLDCHLVLGGEPPSTPNGNLLLDILCNAQIHWSGVLRKGEKIPDIVEELKSKDKKPFVIPYGGSNSTGALGFVDAVRELAIQTSGMKHSFSHIVFPSSSGGTQAGLMVGAKLFNQPFKILGIGIDKGETGDLPFTEYILRLANQTAARFTETIKFAIDDIIIRNEYLGDGYGIAGELEKEAIRLMATLEGILLDPVYTGRAMGALIDLIHKNEFSKNDSILFWHTGGGPALFSYAEKLTNG
jgi:L-cysteate sulfo-lyase